MPARKGEEVAEDDLVIPTWSAAESVLACREGWDIFECDSVDHAEFELQALCEGWVDAKGIEWPAPFLEDDPAAWIHVWTQASKGSNLHQKALAFLKHHARDEWEGVVGYAETVALPESTIIARLQTIANETRS